MEFNIHLNKYLAYALYTVMALTCINTCNTCTNLRSTDRLKKEVDSLTNVVDNMYSKEEMDVRLKINSLELERSTLFNMNNIVLTKNRPDVRLNEIDEKLSQLRK